MSTVAEALSPGANFATVHTREALKHAIFRARDDGRTIALVPTMGALHDGHLALLDRARELADVVVVSVFVNPLQFGLGEDLDRYPRTLARDAERAAERGAHILFAPDEREMYPRGRPTVTVDPGLRGTMLCGAARPGHFRGVLTVVARLFGLAAPEVAVFGRKDLQQSVLVRQMVHDLAMPVCIEVVPTVREADGLAMSSRNRYLSADERRRALALPGALRVCQDRFRAGERDVTALREAALDVLATAALTPEYLEVVDGESLETIRRAVPGSFCAAAVQVGRTRLIDNVELDL